MYGCAGMHKQFEVHMQIMCYLYTYMELHVCSTLAIEEARSKETNTTHIIIIQTRQTGVDVHVHVCNTERCTCTCM